MAWFPPTELGLALGIRQTAIPIGAAIGAASFPVLASASGTKAGFIFLGARLRDRRRRRGDIHPHGSAGRAGARRRLAPGPRPADVAARHVDRALPRGPDRDHQLRRPLPPRASRRVDACGRARARGDLRPRRSAARIGSGTISDRLGDRLRPLRTIGIALTISTAAVAAATDAPLALLIPLFVVAGVLSMAWNGLAYAAAAEAAGSARTGAALGFQQTMLGVVVAAAPPGLRGDRGAQLARSRSSSPRWPRRSACSFYGRCGIRLAVRDPREHAERRRPCRQLAELRIEAAELALTVPRRRLHRGVAHRQRRRAAPRTAPNPSRVRSAAVSISTSISASKTRCRQPMYRVPVLLVGVDEGTRPLETRRRVDDLLAVDLAAPALGLVLRMQGKRRGSRLRCHASIVGADAGLRKS